MCCEMRVMLAGPPKRQWDRRGTACVHGKSECGKLAWYESRTGRVHKWCEIHGTCADMVAESPTLKKWAWRSSWSDLYVSDICGDPFHLHSLSRLLLLDPFISTPFQSVDQVSD